MLWFISDSGESKNGNEIPEIIQFEHETRSMLENWEIHGLTLLENN